MVAVNVGQQHQLQLGGKRFDSLEGNAAVNKDVFIDDHGVAL